MPQKFKVPEGDYAWREAAWGTNLGVIVLAIRQQRTYSWRS